MQRLTAPPRENLTSADVRAILVAPALTVAAGLELLDDQERVVGLLSDELVSGTVHRDNLADVHGTVDLVLTKELAWGRDRVRPFLDLSAGDLTARFHLGVYLLTTPTRELDEDPVWTVAGFDKLHLLQGALPDTYTVPAGTGYLAAARAAILAAGGGSRVLFDSAAETKALPLAMVWPLSENSSSPAADAAPGTQTGSTYLAVVNALLAAVGYRGLWVDQDGYFRSEPYVPPATRPTEWTLDVDDEVATIVAEDRKLTADVWGVPNAWRFVRRDTGATTPPVEGAGVYTVKNLADGPASIASLGREVWSVVFFDAADQASLVTQGDARVASDRRVTAVLEVSTGPLPIAGHLDVVTYRDEALGDDVKLQARGWDLPLDGTDQSWTFEVIS